MATLKELEDPIFRKIFISKVAVDSIELAEGLTLKY